MLIAYLPLEPYTERYTWFLQGWVLERWKGKADLISIGGEQLGSRINVGEVLDAYGRTYWSAIQTATLIEWLQAGNKPDVIFFHDLYHTGFSALPYIFDQLEGKRPLIFTWCWAQSVDPHDFTFPMRSWMRHYEMMVDKNVDGIFVADKSLKQYMRIGMFEANIHVVGLPYDRDSISELVDPKPLEKRSMRILFASRWDKEKQPGFFMDFIEQWAPGLKWEFAVTTGSKELRSNDPDLVKRARDLENEGVLKIYEGMSKKDYYSLLADSRVQINTALQDFVSFTLLDASTMGTPSLLPAYLSFPEQVNYDYRFLYTPWDKEDLYHKLLALIEDPPEQSAIQYASGHHHETLDRTLEIIKNYNDLKKSLVDRSERIP